MRSSASSGRSPARSSLHRLVDVVRGTRHLGDRRAGRRAALGPGVSGADRLVVRVEDVAVGRVEGRVPGEARIEQERLEEPRGVAAVPLGRADVGHRLDRLVLGGERGRQRLGQGPDLPIPAGQLGAATVRVGVVIPPCPFGGSPSPSARGDPIQRSRPSAPRGEWPVQAGLGWPVPPPALPDRPRRACLRPGGGGMLSPTVGRPERDWEFEGGRIGPDWRDSEPWWPPSPPPRTAPNVVLVVLDDVGFAQLGCYGSDIDTPVIDGLADPGRPAGQLPHHRAVLAHPGLPADRAQPPPQRHGPGGRPGHRLPRLLGDGRPRERLPLGDPARPRLRHLRRGQVAPHPRGRDPHGRLPAGRGRSGGASTAGTGSTAGRPTSSSRPSTTTTTRSGRPAYRRGGLPPERRPGRPGHRVRGDLRAVDADRPFFLYLATGACHSPHQRPGRVDRPLPRSLRRRVGRLARAAPSPASWHLGVIPPGTALSPARRGCRPGTTSTAEDQRVAARFMECFAGFLSTPTPRSAGCSHFLGDLGELDNTVVIARVRQRGQRRGRRRRLDQRRPAVQPGPGRHRGDASDRLDEHRRTAHPQQLPVGLDHGRQHALPAVEARGPPGWGGRPVHRQWPAARGRRSAGAVRHQFAHAIDVLPTVLELVGIEAPEEIDRRAQSHRSTARASPTCSSRRRRRARAPRDPALRDARVAGHLPPTGGRR